MQSTFQQKLNAMKHVTIILLMLASQQVFAKKIDESKVPSSVKEAFRKNFAAAKSVKWELEEGNYEANFRNNDVKMAALFDPKGAWLETETRIAIAALPVSVADYVHKNYPGEKIKEAAKLKLANGSDNYEAEVKGQDLIFDANGKYIKTIKD